MIDPVPIFAELFRGRTDAYGTNKGGVVRDVVMQEDYEHHLIGDVAIGIFPMLDDNTVWFGAIDLDEPNFELANKLRTLIPGMKIGRAHV